MPALPLTSFIFSVALLLSATTAEAQTSNAALDASRYADRLQSIWVLQNGYRWTQYFSFQAGYSNRGVSGDNRDSTAEINDFLVSANQLHPHSIASFEPAMVGRYPLSERVSVVGRGGVLYWQTKNHEAADFERLNQSGSDFFIGTGVELRLDRHWNINSDWTRYTVSGERMDVLGLGLRYRLRFK